MFLYSECTELPANWTNMTTDTVFPVPAGTTLNLACIDGFANRGDGSVTCVDKSDYSYVAEPQCISPGM